MTWVNDGDMVVKLQLTHFVPQPSDTDRSNICQLIRRLSSLDKNLPPNVLLMEVLKSNDRRGTSGEFDMTISDEIVGLLKRRAFRVVVRQEVDCTGDVLGGRFFLAIKNKDTDKEMFQAPYYVQGHLDRENWLIHNSTTLSQQAIRLLVSIAKIFGFEIWSEDMNQEFLQGVERILRKVYIHGKPEFQLGDH